MTKALARTVAKITLGVVLISVLTMWAYYPSIYNLFVWDSTHYLVNHVYWISSLGIDHIIWMFLSLEVANWHPLTWVSWAIDYQLYGGLVPWGYHFTNNILHIINSILVFASMLVVFALNNPTSKSYPFSTDNNALIAAFLATLFFAVHPQHVESVAWVAERKDLLCQLFLLLSMLTYVRYVSCHEEAKKRWFNGTLGLFLLAVLSKPMAVTFPVVLLLLDIYPLRRTALINSVNDSIKQQYFYTLLREKLPFFLLSVLLVLVTLYAQQVALSSMPFDLRVLNAFNSIVFYLNKLLLPVYFVAHYPYFIDIGGNISWKAFVPLLGVLGLTLASLLAWTKGHYAWLIAWLFYLVTLSPVLGLIQVGQQGAADRYAYLPTLPFYFLMGAGILALLNKTTPLHKAFMLLAILPIMFLLIDKTRQQVQVWESPQSLWAHVVKYYPDNIKARHNLGVVYLNLRNYEKAALQFDESIELQVAPVSSLALRGLTYIYLDRYEEALKDYIDLGTFSQHRPDLNLEWDCINFNIGWLYAQTGDVEKSVQLFSKVQQNSQLQPDVKIWLNQLENNNLSDREKLQSDKLPNFCTRIFSSNVRFTNLRRVQVTE